MCRTRSDRLINALEQNASPSIYRLSPEIIGEIFLLAQPEVLPKEEELLWDKLVRYLVTITSITGHFRRIALDFGELWSVVGFSLGRNDADRCSVVLVIVEAFLERSRGCNLHFWMTDDLTSSRPTSFYSGLVTLIKPHTGRVQTFYFRQNGYGHKAREELYVLVNDAVNLNKLTLHIFPYLAPRPPLRITNTLRKLKELRLSGFVYDPSLQETMEQVEILDLSHGIVDHHQWLGSCIKLKRLVLPNYEVTGPFINPKPSVRLGDLTYLRTNFELYQYITTWISLPSLRHLDVYMSSLNPPTLSHIEPNGHHYPLLRTLRMVLSPMQAFGLDEVALIIMNPQLEYLEIDWGWCGASLSWVLSELSDRRFTAPSGALFTFPGSSLKYLRMTVRDRGPDLALQSGFLSSILSNDSQLKLDLLGWRSAVTCNALMEQFPSQVKCYDGYSDSIPLHELYDRAQTE